MLETVQRPSFIKFYDVTPQTVEFLSAFLCSALPSDALEPLVMPAVARNVTWQAYEPFLEATQDRVLRHSYMDRVLELMSPRLLERENTKAVLRRFVQTLTLETKQPIVTLGTTTLASPSECIG